MCLIQNERVKFETNKWKKSRRQFGYNLERTGSGRHGSSLFEMIDTPFKIHRKVEQYVISTTESANLEDAHAKCFDPMLYMSPHAVIVA